MQRLGGTSFALLTVVISLSIIIESHENTIVEFDFLFEQMEMQNIYLWYAPIHCSSS